MHERQFPSDGALVTPRVVRLTEFLVARCFIDAENKNRVGVCLEEGRRNAVVHGNREDFKKMVTVRVFKGDDSWSIQIDDEGDGFTLAELPDPADDATVWRENGGGRSIMVVYASAAAYFRSGRTLVLTFAQ